MSPTPRVAGLQDIAVLVELMAEFYAESGYPLPRATAGRAFSTIITDPRLGRVLIVDVDGAPAGYLVLTFAFSMEYGGLRGFVDDFFVRPEARGRGAGAAALQSVREICLKSGIVGVLVEVGANGDSARRLYERAGFEETGRALLSQALAPALHEHSTLSDANASIKPQLNVIRTPV